MVTPRTPAPAVRLAGAGAHVADATQPSTQATARAHRRPAWVDDRLYPFESRFVDVPGQPGPMHYVDEGPRQAPVQLFLGGGFGWSFTFRHYLAGLRGRFRCVAPDYPGFGPSPGTPQRAPTVDGLARAVEGFVEALDLRDVTLWLNDVGGPVGMRFATQQPERVRALVLGGTFGWSLEAYPKVERMLGMVSGAGFRWVNRRTNLLPRTMGGAALGTRKLSVAERAMYTAPFTPPHADLARRDHAMRLLGDLGADKAGNRAMEQGLAKLRDRPALLVFGDKDEAVKMGWHTRWQRELPHSRLHMLPGVKHFPFEDAPKQVLRHFTAWWPEVEEAGRV